MRVKTDNTEIKTTILPPKFKQSFEPIRIKTEREEIFSGKKLIFKASADTLVIQGQIPTKAQKRILKFYRECAFDFLKINVQKAAKKLLPEAQSEDFVPNGAVGTLIVSRFDGKILSIAADMNFFNGQSSKCKRRCENWDVGTGFLIGFDDLFKKGARKFLKKKFAESGKSDFCADNFFLTGSDIYFCAPTSLSLPDSQHKTLKIPLSEFSDAGFSALEI